MGAQLYAQCAPTIKKLGLELGGNAPFIVFNDAAQQRLVDAINDDGRIYLTQGAFAGQKIIRV